MAATASGRRRRPAARRGDHRRHRRRGRSAAAAGAAHVRARGGAGAVAAAGRAGDDPPAARMRVRPLPAAPATPARPRAGPARADPAVPVAPPPSGSLRPPRPGRPTATPPDPALGVHRHRRLPARDAARPPDRGPGRSARRLPARRRDGQHQAGRAARGPRPHPRRRRETVGGQRLCGHRDDRARHAARRRRRGPRPGHPGRDGARPAARAALGSYPALRHQRCAARPGLLQRLALPPIPVATGVDERRALSLLEQPGRYPGVAVAPSRCATTRPRAGSTRATLLGYLGRADAARRSATSAGRDRGHRPGRPGRAGAASTTPCLRGVSGRTTARRSTPGAWSPATVGQPTRCTGDDVVTNLDRAGPVGQREGPGRRGGHGAHARGHRADSGAAVVLDVTQRRRSSRRPATRPTTRTSGPAGSPRATSTRSPTRRPGTPLVIRVTSSGCSRPASTFKVVSLPAAVEAGNSAARHLRLHVQLPDRQPPVRRTSSPAPTARSPCAGRSSRSPATRSSTTSPTARGWPRAACAATTDARDPFVAMAQRVRPGPRHRGRPAGGERRPDPRPAVEAGDVGGHADRDLRAGHGPATPRRPPRTRPRAAYLKALGGRELRRAASSSAPGDAANFAIGQGDIAVTPLQMAQVYAAIANGGTLWTPAGRHGPSRTPDGRTVPTVAAAAGGHGAARRDDAAPSCDDALRGVVAEGTAAGAFAGFPLDDLPGGRQDRHR